MSVFSQSAEAPVEQADWNPPDNKRTYYRRSTDGQLGWLVRRAGRQMIRLDRPDEQIRALVDGEWVPDREHRPLNRGQVAQVCFAADRALCLALGLHKEAKREWIELRQEDKKVWLHEGPPTPKVRSVVFERIRDALEHLTT